MVLALSVFLNSLLSRVSDVIYNPEVEQTVPVEFKGILAFALSSKPDGKIIVPGKSIKMNLKDGVDIVKDKLGHPTFNDRKQYSDLHDNQIRAYNGAGQPVALTVGFHNGKTVDPAGYIGDLPRNSSWIAAYRPDMKLYVAGDAKSGQIIDTISKSNLIYTWELADDLKVPNGSHWLLTKSKDGIYHIAANFNNKGA
ncbi:hypothetical protein AX14_000691 [Amanita brunnescens Koide BX004]|nr:hypothetical protein AX14_000691 [Amanita brunnescens Koide BX004]